MYDGVNQNLSQHSKNDLSGWDRLIAEANDQIRDLQRAIKHFERNKANGEPYFGQQGVRAFKSADEVLGQEGVLGQSPASLCPLKKNFDGVLRQRG